ncbi:MAG: hypothetical protein IPP74_14540 [Alphaproteobacteria bacterium]|nr:hypothetical protein [Alphaproteobacteria bacterium]
MLRKAPSRGTRDLNFHTSEGKITIDGFQIGLSLKKIDNMLTMVVTKSGCDKSRIGTVGSARFPTGTALGVSKLTTF